LQTDFRLGSAKLILLVAEYDCGPGSGRIEPGKFCPVFPSPLIPDITGASPSPEGFSDCCGGQQCNVAVSQRQIIMSTHQYHPDFVQLSAQTLIELLQLRAQVNEQNPAFTFLADGDSQEEQITYGELDRRARAIAARLQKLCAKGDRAVLLYAPGLEYVAGFFGCLYAGMIAVPAYPPNPVRPRPGLPRIQTIVSDSQARVVLTSSGILAKTASLFEIAPDLAAPQWIATEEIENGAESEWQQPEISPQSTAFLQYTSGSTGAPRGVMISHENLLHNLRLISHGFENSPGDSGVIWLPPYHDMGLIGGLLQPVFLGVRTILIPPVAFLQRPFRWLQAISKFKGTVSGGPNFAYDLARRRVTPEQKAQLDLSSWKVAFNGAEPVRAQTLDDFAQAFAECGFRREAFYPCYGMAETTLIATGGVRAEAPVFCTIESAALEQNQIVESEAGTDGSRTLVSSGRALPDLRIIIVDPETQTFCAADQVGEIWIAGPSVALGYWNRPEESARTFQAFLADTGKGPFLRTGDLGFLRNGELFVTGRLKDLIIIDGRNHYPQDIEATAEQSHPDIRKGAVAAFPIDQGNQERLVVVAEVERTSRIHRQKANGGDTGTAEEAVRAITEAIRRAISENHDVRVHAIALVKPGRIPLTSSGKIRRRDCRAAFLNGTLENLEE
jgi:acyl-CoA synthetase (AMP-forming)/AMP-acid ligase II